MSKKSKVPTCGSAIRIRSRWSGQKNNPHRNHPLHHVDPRYSGDTFYYVPQTVSEQEKSVLPYKNAWLACGMILLLSAVYCEVAVFFFDPAMLAYAEEGQQATIEDAKQEASQEAAKAGEHAQNLKQSVKKDTTTVWKTIKSGVKSGFSILKEGIKSLSRGKGVKVKKSTREEQNPYDP